MRILATNNLDKNPVRPRLRVLNKVLIISIIGTFLLYKNEQVSPQVSVAAFVFILYRPMPRKFKKARLVIPATQSKDQRWVIKYYAEDMNGIYRAFRETDCNSIANIADRRAYCKERIAYINQMLVKGAQVDEESIDNEELMVSQSITNALSSKFGLRPKTEKNYRDYANKFLLWLQTNNKDVKITRVTKSMAMEFIQYLVSCNLSNRTINNHISHLSTLFNRAGEINPFKGIEKLQEDIGRNIAFNKEQTAELVTYMQAKWPDMLVACQFMYYTLARTNEISHIKVSDIAKYHPDQIYLDEKYSKNRSARNISIPPQLRSILQAFLSKHEHSPDDYLFSRNFRPGKHHFPSPQMADRFRMNVLNKLNFSADYTFYSWKHTGVVNLYITGVAPAAIRMQLGHMNTQSFEQYLKSLGLFQNNELINGFPTL